jgi:hypothetical protein
MKSYCSTLGFFFLHLKSEMDWAWSSYLHFSSSDVEIERTFIVALEML